MTHKTMLFNKGLQPLALILFLAAPLFAAVPRIMNYQAKLTDSSGVALTGTDTIAFCIYDTSEAGSPLWGETLSVNIVNGLFDVQLGNTHPINLDFSVPYWMELSISTDGGTTWEIFSPREKLAPVSFSYRAIYADTADYAPSAGGAYLYFGDGSDGDVTISADTTLTRDMYYNNLTINSGYTLHTHGYRIWVNETLSGGGVIDNNGNPGNNGSDGATDSSTPGGGGGSGAPGGTLAGAPGGGAGGQGAASSLPDAGYPRDPANKTSIGVHGSHGGTGGTGVNSSGATGGVGGGVSNETLDTREIGRKLSVADSGIEKNRFTLLYFFGTTSGENLSTSAISGGGGGASGKHTTDHDYHGGGGGGAGGTGGNIEIVARIISGTLTIQAKGGNGGNGGNGDSGNGEAGGGGGAGGAGGNVLLIYKDISAYTGTIDVSGGAGGAGGTGYHNGASGADGLSGHIFKVKVID